jgi:hypothetical protein
MEILDNNRNRVMLLFSKMNTLLYVIIHQDNPRMMTNISWKYNGTAIIILRVSV